MIGVAAQFGVLRLLSHWVPLDHYGLWLSRPSEYAALCDDLLSLERVPASARASKSAGSLGALPVIVLTIVNLFRVLFDSDKNWNEGQARLATLSTDSALVVRKTAII